MRRQTSSPSPNAPHPAATSTSEVSPHRWSALSPHHSADPSFPPNLTPAQRAHLRRLAPKAGDARFFQALSGAAFLWCPPGSFRMGSDGTNEYVGADEKPARNVTLTRGFWMKQTPITQAEWQAFAAFNPSHFKNAGPNAPVERVSWYEAVWFCNLLSKKEDLSPAYRLENVTGTWGEKDFRIQQIEILAEASGYRLPTEAEWEYACRAGTTTATSNTASPFEVKGLNNAPNLDKIAWYGGNSGVDYEGGYESSGWSEKQHESKASGTHPVGQKQPNAWGLSDMLGNVWEWCFSVYGSSYEGRDTSDPRRTSDGSERVARGGSWNDYARAVRSASRYRSAPAVRYDNLGFRLLRYP